MADEEWRPVPGFGGFYEVSDQGRVRSLDREVWRMSRSGNEYVWLRPGHIMKQYRIPNPRRYWHRYWQVKLWDHGRQRHVVVHQLVAEVFLGPRPEGQQVRHGPAGLVDNSVENLSYGTPQDQADDRRRDGTVNIGEQNPASKLTEADVASIRDRVANGERQIRLAEEYGVSRSTISTIISRQRWSSSL